MVLAKLAILLKKEIKVAKWGTPKKYLKIHVRKMDRKTEGQRDRGTEGQRDRETERQRDRETEI
jgi:hypothetical protein